MNKDVTGRLWWGGVVGRARGGLFLISPFAWHSRAIGVLNPHPGPLLIEGRGRVVVLSKGCGSLDEQLLRRRRAEDPDSESGEAIAPWQLLSCFTRRRLTGRAGARRSVGKRSRMQRNPHAGSVRYGGGRGYLALREEGLGLR